MTSSSAPSGIDAASFSPTVAPGDDFFRYVNGPWLDAHEIPADRAADGAFHKLRDDAEEHVRAIIEEAAPDTQVGALYASFMDTDRAEALGVSPLADDLALVDSATTPEELAAAVGALQRHGVGGVVGYYVFA